MFHTFINIRVFWWYFFECCLLHNAVMSFNKICLCCVWSCVSLTHLFFLWGGSIRLISCVILRSSQVIFREPFCGPWWLLYYFIICTTIWSDDIVCINSWSVSINIASNIFVFHFFPPLETIWLKKVPKAEREGFSFCMDFVFDLLVICCFMFVWLFNTPLWGVWALLMYVTVIVHVVPFI